MTIELSSLQPIVALACGVAILIIPKLLNYIVAGYLILILPPFHRTLRRLRFGLR